uniref:LysM and putative peptidoglycan-binding domain-containing protein 1 n=1 Tax=Leptobrachium leishanense TaxID=445787 RepID=A0A8C5PC54_9ANUR
MASPHRAGDSGLLRSSRTRSYGSLVQSSYSPARVRKVEHPVRPGDTLQGLALKYGVSMEQIKRANRLYTNDSIFLKKVLSIPVLCDQPELSNGLESPEGLEGGGPGVETSSITQTEREKSRRHENESHAGARAELSASDFMSNLDTKIRVSKRAAVKKLKEAETQVSQDDRETAGATGYQRPQADRSRESSPQTQQRSLLGPVPLTITTRASTIKDHEDEIFKL